LDDFENLIDEEISNHPDEEDTPDDSGDSNEPDNSDQDE
jgi:hypothetical protein